MYYPLFSQYSSVFSAIFNVETYDCTNTLWLEKNVGIKVQPLSTDWIPPFLIQLLLLLYYVTYLHYIIYFSNIKALFLKIIKTERFRSVFYVLIFFWKHNSFIQLNCNEVINCVNNYENYDWYPNTEVRID